MNRTRTLAVLLAVPVLAVALALWFGARHERGAEPASERIVAADAAAPSTAEELAVPDVALPEPDAVLPEPSARIEVTARDETGPDGAPSLSTPLFRVRGYVTDQDGTSLESFVVRARSVAGEGRRSSIGRGGAFELVELAAGEWELSIRAVGHARTEVVVRLPEQAGETLAIVVARLASITGIVIAPNGAPVAEAAVLVIDGNDQGTQTDASGRFVLADLTTVGVSLQAQAEGWAASEPLFVAAPSTGAPAEDVVLRLRAGGVVHGEVLDELGRPIVGHAVRLGADEIFWTDGARETTTDSAGAFRLEHVDPGQWTILAGPPNDEIDAFEDAHPEADPDEVAIAFLAQFVSAEVEVLDGAETFVRLQARAKQPVAVLGRLTEAGRPVRDTQVFVLLEEDGTPLTSMKAARTGAGGAFEVTLDRPGTYAFTVLDDEEEPTAVFSIEVGAAAEQRVELALPTGRIEGTVRGPDGPVEGAAVTIELEEGGSRLAFLAHVEGRETGAQGEFVFDRLQPGTYAVRTGDHGDFGTLTPHPLQLASAVRGGIRVGEGARVTGVDLELVPGGVIAGRARDAAGNVVRGAAVFVRLADGRLLEPYSTVVSDAGGRFRCEGLVPGPVTLLARSEQLAAAEGRPVAVVAGEITQVELVLAPAALLEITVVDAAGRPVAAELAVLDAHGFDLARLRSQEALEALLMRGAPAGTHTLGPLPLGSYAVSARASGGRGARTSVALDAPGVKKLQIRLPD